jgi:hypothetical protein
MGMNNRPPGRNTPPDQRTRHGVALNTLAPLLGTATHGWLTVCGLMLSAGALAMAFAPARFGLVGLAVCWLAIVLPATLSPQFTVTAGLLFAAGAAWFLVDGKGRFGCTLAIASLVFGYILRPESFYLGLVVEPAVRELARYGDVGIYDLSSPKNP